ncbi:hypothetical protein JW916_13085 [Candidatus Sumerlaeota bacterium]|nr:hypothetical protein [Candidatus Sumerlaeota bacterium]
MSFQDGWAAMNLEMPPRVPRTEYSAERHWDLVKATTGIEVTSETPAEEQFQASCAFRKAWNYDFVWAIRTLDAIFGNVKTRMGHAEYATGGTDYDDQIYCPFSDPEEVLRFDPMETYGPCDRAKFVKKFEDQYRRFATAIPDAVNMSGIYVTLVSGLLEIFGWDMLLLAAGLDPDGFGEVANRYTLWIGQYFEALADADVPVVMVHDDIVWSSGPFIHPDWYRRFIFPNYKKLLAPLIEAKKRIMYTSDGNYSLFIDDIAACGVNGFVMEPTTDMAYIAEKYGKTHVFVGNADTRILLSGTREDIRREVERCMKIGKGCPGYFMAVGNHIPSNTPVENALYYNEVYEELGRR